MTGSSSLPRIRLAVLIAVALGLGACEGRVGQWWRKEADAEGRAVQETATPVVVGSTWRGPITASIGAASTIEAERQVLVHAESTGRIIKLSIEEGDHVKKGQLLARVKYDAQSSLLDRASTSLDKTRADYETVKSLYARKVASKEELDAARIAYETAQIDVRDRRRDIRNTKVTAPFSGTVTERFVEEGGFVAAGAQLLAITDFDTLVARVYVPEKELDRIVVGQSAEIVGKAARGRKGVGEVKRIAPVVDAATGTIKITVGLPKDLAGGESGFLPGMYAEVTLTTETRNEALLLSKQSLVHEDEQSFVFVTDGSRVRRARVTLGLSDGENAEVVSGLSEGDEVVTAGQSGLKDGSLIRRVDHNGNPLEPDPQGEVSDALADGHSDGSRELGKSAEGA